jgi:hypothetical protein
MIGDPIMSSVTSEALLKTLAGKDPPTSDQFKELVIRLDSHNILAKVFLLEGTPFVFKNSPMKYVIFREQVADRFEIGSQDVCIVGSAKLGFSPSSHQYGRRFEETSDVDVVLISEPLFHRGSRELFRVLNQLGPGVHEIRPFLERNGEPSRGQPPHVDLKDWKLVKEAVRNFVYQNFNPGLLPYEHHMRQEIFGNISSTAGLFLALEPQVFVSKIRGRVFRNWKAAEDYYANSLREAKRALEGAEDVDSDADVEDEAATSPVAAAPKKKDGQ